MSIGFRNGKIEGLEMAKDVIRGDRQAFSDEGGRGDEIFALNHALGRIDALINKLKHDHDQS